MRGGRQRLCCVDLAGACIVLHVAAVLGCDRWVGFSDCGPLSLASAGRTGDKLKESVLSGNDQA